MPVLSVMAKAETFPPDLSKVHRRQEFALAFMREQSGLPSGKTHVCIVPDCGSAYTIVDKGQFGAAEKHLKKVHQLTFADLAARRKTQRNPGEGDATSMCVLTDIGERRLVYSHVDHNLPLAMWDDRYFKETLAAAYQKITVKSFRELVIKTADHIKAEHRAAAKMSTVTICIDLGTTHDMHTFAATVIARTETTTTTFVHTVEAIDSATADSLRPRIMRVIDDMRSQCDRIVAIVTDNGPNVVAACAGIGIPHIRCGAHTLQLFMKNFISNNTKLQAAKALMDLYSAYITKPCPTRWWSDVKSLQELEKFLASESAANPSNREYVDHLNTVKAAVAILERFLIRGRQLERDDTSIPEAMQLIHEMTSLDETDAVGIQRRFVKFAVCPVVVAVAVLHPGVDYSSFSEAEKDRAIEIIGTIGKDAEECAAIKKELVRLLTSDSRPANIWEPQGTSNRYPKLLSMMRSLNESAATEASVERYFSHQRLTHTCLRARMGEDLLAASATIRFRNKASRDQKAEDRKRARENDAKEDPVPAAAADAGAVVVVPAAAMVPHVPKSKREKLPKPVLTAAAATYFFDLFIRADTFARIEAKKSVVAFGEKGRSFKVSEKSGQRADKLTVSTSSEIVHDVLASEHRIKILN